MLNSQGQQQISRAEAAATAGAKGVAGVSSEQRHVALFELTAYLQVGGGERIE